ncbi:MAG: hypothetical protein U0941_13310 [Planctomycetaceae bacterium]
MMVIYEPVFTEYPDDLSERWKRIRRFAEQIYETEIPWNKRVPGSVKQLEATLGHSLPTSIIEWMTFGRDLI